MSSASRNLILKNICGITGRSNDIIYTKPVLSPSQDFLVYFGGDVQDIEDNMKKHADSKKYIEWNLENTGRILSQNFRKKHILIIRPSRIHVTRNAMFSCFDNFVPGNQYGVPSFKPMHNAFQHLLKLLNSCLEQLQTRSKNEDPANFNINNIKLTLLGFSKGCVVLNQFLHEFHYLQTEQKYDSEIGNLLKAIESMWWLDGGHGGTENTWITDNSILNSFAKLQIRVYVHVTPYQVKDTHRPWIASEEARFYDILRNMGVAIQRTLHYGDDPKSLKLHFSILKIVKNDAELE